MWASVLRSMACQRGGNYLHLLIARKEISFFLSTSATSTSLPGRLLTPGNLMSIPLASAWSIYSMRSDNSPVDSLKNDFDQESTALRAKADRLEKEIDFALKDCYEPIHKVCTLQNKLEGFESWTEFRVEYDRLATQSEAESKRGKLARAADSYRERSTVQLKSIKQPDTIYEVAHRQELRLMKQQRN